jgi:hypothetical protein
MKEVCGAGWRVGYNRYWTGQNSWQATPKVDDIVSALEECYALTSGQKDKLSKAAVKHASAYSLPRVVDEHFLPALREIEQRFANQQPVTIAPRLKAAA